MLRATSPRGEDDPTVPREPETTTRSLESLLALALCAVVLLASVAFLRRSSALSRALAELQETSLRTGVDRPKRPGGLPGTGARPELVILISLESLRADRLGLYGYARETAPNLRRLGEESVVFLRTSAQSSQPLTSHKSLFTGKYPTTLMLEETGADLIELSAVRLPRDYMVDTFSAVKGRLAAGFRERGFRTAGLTDGAWLSRQSGFEHGFDLFDDSGGGLAALLPRAVGWLEANAAQPAFLFLEAHDLQCPYTSREPFTGAFCSDHAAHVARERLDPCGSGAENETQLSAAELATLSAHYDGGLLSADDYLGRFFEELRRRGLYERALIVVTSAHGESLGERDRIGHGGLSLEQLLVPLLVKFPSDWHVGSRRVEEAVELIDLLPTLFALCGIATDPDLDGRSLLPTILRGVHGRDCLMAQTSFEEAPDGRSNPAKRTLFRPDRWQVIQDPAGSKASFFALGRDPAGLEPHEIQAAEFASFLDVLLERGRKASRAVLRHSEPVEFSPELEHELVELGYAGPTRSVAGDGAATDIR